jgi:hypothetical protein
MRSGVFFYHLTLREPEPIVTVALRRTHYNAGPERGGTTEVAKQHGVGLHGAMAIRHPGDEWNPHLGTWLAFRRLHTLGSASPFDTVAWAKLESTTLSWFAHGPEDLAEAIRDRVFNMPSIQRAGSYLGERSFSRVVESTRHVYQMMVDHEIRFTAPEEFTPRALGRKLGQHG